MKKELIVLLEGFKSDSRMLFYDEVRTKQAIVMSILNSIGWDTFNVEEVFPEYPVAGAVVDFALRHDNENKVFISIKRSGEPLDKFEHDFVNISKQGSADIAVLTNGIEWWFYLPGRKDEPGKYKFQNLDIKHQNPETLAKKFLIYLSHERVIKGKAAEDAEKVFRSRKKKRLVRHALLEVWNRFKSGNDQVLTYMFASEAEKLCSYLPDPEDVLIFLKLISKRERGRKPSAMKMLDEKLTAKMKPGPKPKVKGRRGRKPLAGSNGGNGGVKSERRVLHAGRKDSFIGKKPKSFTFLGQRQPVKKWKEILTSVCNILSRVKEDDFENVLTLSGRKRTYFSRSPKDLKEPRLISGTDIYVETNFNASNLYMIAIKVLKSFGYNETSIQIETR